MTGARLDDHGPGAYVSIGHGGWSIKFADGNCTLSHYGDTWREHLDELAPGAPVIDLTACDWDTLVDLSVRGPMVGLDVEPGTRNLPISRETVPLDYSAEFFGARSLDYVSLDDYVRLARQAGASVTMAPHS